ncbi:MAG: 50S ribosomal protein L29 [candidate division WOR-3 bacterium]|nr:50S ribosomal protein L29 [candidate division WOR-3 bacterium]
MKVYELREKSREELIEMLNGLYRELFNLRVRHAIQKLPNPLRLRMIRKEIARIRTILREDELGKRKLISRQVEAKTKSKKGV